MGDTNTESDMKCSCGEECILVEGNYCCQKCDNAFITGVAKVYYERALLKAIGKISKKRSMYTTEKGGNLNGN